MYLTYFDLYLHRFFLQRKNDLFLFHRTIRGRRCQELLIFVSLHPLCYGRIGNKGNYSNIYYFFLTYSGYTTVCRDTSLTALVSVLICSVYRLFHIGKIVFNSSNSDARPCLFPIIYLPTSDGWFELLMTSETLPIVQWTVFFPPFVLVALLISFIRLPASKGILPPMAVLSLTHRALQQLLVILWGACMPFSVCHALLEPSCRIRWVCLSCLAAAASISSTLGTSCAISIV